MKFLSYLFIVFSIMTTSASAQSCAMPSKDFDVLIVKAANHPALNQTEQGIRDTLKKNPKFKGVQISTTDMQGQLKIAATAIQQKAQSGRELIVFTIGTTPSQVALKIARKRKNVKVIFASVTAPVDSKLVKSNTQTDPCISGVSNMFDVKPQIEMFKKIQPNLKKLGCLYNPGEANSVAMVEEISKACQQTCIQFEKQGLDSSARAAAAAKILAAKVDAIFVSNDNLALTCIPIISRTGGENGVPLYVSDTDVVTEGALLAYGPDQYDIGRQAGEMAIRLVNGVSLDKQPVQFPETGMVCINADTAEQLNMPIPAKIARSAVFVNRQSV